MDPFLRFAAHIYCLYDHNSRYPTLTAVFVRLLMYIYNVSGRYGAKSGFDNFVGGNWVREYFVNCMECNRCFHNDASQSRAYSQIDLWLLSGGKYILNSSMNFKHNFPWNLLHYLYICVRVYVLCYMECGKRTCQTSIVCLRRAALQAICMFTTEACAHNV